MPYRLAIAQESLCILSNPEALDIKKGWVEGLEPSASRATIWRASQLRHTHHINLKCARRDSNPRPTA